MQWNFWLEIEARRAAFRATTQRTRLVYAASVHTLSLIIAALAWPRLRCTYRAIDMILARRRNGTLAVASSACRLPKVPAEIWNIIKQYIALALFTEEEDHFLCNLHAAKSRVVSRSISPRPCYDCKLVVQNVGMANLFSKHSEVSVCQDPRETTPFFNNNLQCWEHRPEC